MQLEIKKNQLEQALETTKKNRHHYSWIMLFLFLIGSKYFCKGVNSKLYNEQCLKEFICSSEATLGSDYIIDNETHIESFIFSINIYCSQNKAVLLSLFYYIGGLIGLIICPFLISTIGCLNSIIVGYFIYFIACCFISFLPNYVLGVIMYGLLFVEFSFHLTAIYYPND